MFERSLSSTLRRRHRFSVLRNDRTSKLRRYIVFESTRTEVRLLAQDRGGGNVSVSVCLPVSSPLVFLYLWTRVKPGPALSTCEVHGLL